MHNGEKAVLWHEALLLRCDRCENKTCGYFSERPMDSMFDAVGGANSIIDLSSGNTSSFIDWASHGFCAFEVAQWYENGVPRADRAHKLLKAGVSISDLKDIIARANWNKSLAESRKQKNKGGNSDEIRKRGENISKAAAR